MTTRRTVPLLAVAVAALAAITVAAIGGTLTRIGPWYLALAKPAWKPPDWTFGPIWTAIFAMAAISGVTAWRAARSPVTREWIIGLFALNGFLNILWSLLFFALKRPDWALWETAPFWASIAALIFATWRLSRAASLWLLPYLAWVTAAIVLNFHVVRLNAPFGAR